MSLFTKAETQTINKALKIVESKRTISNAISSSELAKNEAILFNATFEREVFTVFLLNSQNQIIDRVALFYGTINAAMVYTREVVKLVLYSNAQSIIISHNHPSGSLEPSPADIRLTKELVSALDLIDVSILDHILTGFGQAVSFRELGII